MMCFTFYRSIICMQEVLTSLFLLSCHPFAKLICFLTFKRPNTGLQSQQNTDYNSCPPRQNVFKKNIKLVSTWLSELSLLFGRQIIIVRLSLIPITTQIQVPVFRGKLSFVSKCLSVFQWNQCLSDASLAAMYASALWNMSAREIKGCSWRRPSVELPGVGGGRLWFIMKTLLGGHCGKMLGKTFIISKQSPMVCLTDEFRDNFNS